MLWKRSFSVYQDSAHSNIQQIYSQHPSSLPHKKPKKQVKNQKRPLQLLGVQTIQQSVKPKNKNTIYLYKGNNHNLIRDIFKSYGYIETISKQDASIIWSQCSQQIPRIPSACFAINFLENHQSITNKERLYRNLKRYNQGQNSHGKYLPDTYIIDFKNGVVETDFVQFLVRYFSPKSMRMKLRKMQQKHQQFSVSNSYGQFNIPYRKVIIDQASIDTFKETKTPVWILKPASLNRGRGIHLFTTLKQLKSHLSQDYHQMSINMYQQTHSPSSYVIQQYIQKPLLIQGFKFDIRMWTLVTMDRSQKRLKCYMYQEGYIRISGTKYHNNSPNQAQQEQNDSPKQDKHNQSQTKGVNLKSIINDKFMHLTNNSVQKNSKNYGSLYEGNIVPMKYLQRYFETKICLESILTQFKQIIIDSINSVKTKLGLSYTVDTKPSSKGPNQFQLFGYDFLIDQQFKIWLIEINSNPSLQQSSQYLSQLINSMLRQMIQTLNLNININKEFKQAKIKLSQLKQKYSKEKDVNYRKKDSLYNLKDLPLSNKQKVMKLTSHGISKQKVKDILRISSQFQSGQMGNTANIQIKQQNSICIKIKQQKQLNESQIEQGKQKDSQSLHKQGQINQRILPPESPNEQIGNKCKWIQLI